MSTEIFEVIQPGPLTTIQDRGRSGYQQFGVPTSGALDSFAFRVGNLLVGNAEGAASLEITLLGCQLRALQEAMIAITGADLAATVNGAPRSKWTASGAISATSIRQKKRTQHTAKRLESITASSPTSASPTPRRSSELSAQVSVQRFRQPN